MTDLYFNPALPFLICLEIVVWDIYLTFLLCCLDKSLVDLFLSFMESLIFFLCYLVSFVGLPERELGAKSRLALNYLNHLLIVTSEISNYLLIDLKEILF